ncbi:MAG: element excision factor XisI family protein [Bacteroidota bacterium]
MVKAIDKREVIKNFLLEYQDLPNEDYPHLRNILSMDETECHFILSCLGWNDGLFTYYTVFHFELQESGRIIVHENRTDNPLDEWFEANGVPSDILLAAWNLEPEEEVAR